MDLKGSTVWTIVGVIVVGFFALLIWGQGVHSERRKACEAAGGYYKQGIKEYSICLRRDSVITLEPSK